MGKTAQRAKLTLKAVPNELTDVVNDYYLNVKIQKQLTIADLAREFATTHGHHTASEVEMIINETLELANWYLSNGYTVTTPMGSFRPVVNGGVMESELSSAPNRDKIRLSVAYTSSASLREELANAELDVEILKADNGPKVFSVADARQVEQSKLPDADTRVPIPVEPGQTCIVSGRNIKVGGPDESLGITLKRVDGSTGTTYFFPVSKLYPNTPTRVGFVLPAEVEEGSEWQVTVKTQLSSNGSTVLKAPRTVTWENTFTVGEVTSTPTPPGTGGSGEDGDDNEGGGSDTGDDGQIENPLG